MNRIFLYVHTLRYLKWKQIFYHTLYFLRPYCLPAPGCGMTLSTSNPPGLPDIASPFMPAAPCYYRGVFTFLNRFKTFPAAPDWSFAEYGKLWAYHLNYFDYLNQPDMTAEEGLGLIRSFLASMDRNRVGMEPYPISLRGMNWIKFLTRWGIRDEAVDAALYRQYRHLLNNLEYHLLGNHLLENGFSLLFGACYFGNTRFYGKAAEILWEELAEQILPDGGHFERSSMYHQIMLGRVLDGINLLKSDRVKSRQELTSLLVEKAARMLGWLEQMTFQNGSIPLMNDAAFGMSPATAELAAYADRLGVSARCVPLNESGYRKFGNDVYEVVLDVGDIGPDYIPGHAHSDTLSFELHVGGCPVIVDSGTSTYEDCPLRHWQRSTRAHNTVEIDGQDQSEVWGSFRVARRARVTELRESENEITAMHDGYRRLPGKPEHRRKWAFTDSGVRIHDNIKGSFTQALSRFHFHPDVQIETAGDSLQSGNLLIPGAAVLSWHIQKGEGRPVKTTYHPEFNVGLSNLCLEVRFQGPETVVEFVWSEKDHPSTGSG